LKKNINKIYHTLQFFQIIQIENLKYKNIQFDILTLKDNMLTLDNKSIYLKGLIESKQKHLTFNIYKLYLKNFNLTMHNIYNKFYFVSSQIDITSDINYRDMHSKFNITIMKNLNIFYNGEINSLSKNTLAKFKQYLDTINDFKINKIYIKGTQEKCYFTIYNLKIKDKYANITTPLITGEFTIKKQKLFANINKLNLISYGNKITMKKTKIYAHLNKDSVHIINKETNILNKKYSIFLLDSKLSYLNNMVNIFINTLKLKQKNLSATLKHIKGKYIQNNISLLIPTIITKNNQITSFLKNNTIKYNIKNKKLITNTSNITLNNKKYHINLQTISSQYQKSILNGNIHNIQFNMDNISCMIFNNRFNYNLNTNRLQIKNNNANINYKKIKNIKAYNIKTNYNISQNSFNTNIDKISIKNTHITNTKITKKNNLINVFFHTNALLSKTLINILNQIDINIPIYQEYGKNNINAHITYNLGNKKINTNIKINVLNSKLMLNKNNYLDIHKSNITFKNNILYLKNTLLDYKKSLISLRYFINNGIINLHKSYIKTSGVFKKLNIKNIAYLKNYPEKVFIDLKGIDILLQNLQVDLLLRNNIIINIKKFSTLYPYVSYLKEYKLKNGNAKIIIGDKIKIISDITNTHQKIILKHLKPLKEIKVHTIIDKDKYIVYNKDINVSLKNQNNNINIIGSYKNLDLNVTKFVDQNSSDSNTTIQAKLDANNTYIIYNKSKLYSKKLSIDYNQTYTNIISLYNNRKIIIKYNNGNFKLYGINIKEKTFRDLTNSNILRKPLLDVFILKNKDSNITHGFIDIKTGYIKELKALTNILAFINLVPSIVTFQSPGFSSKGYKIKHGHIDFMMLNNILYLKNLSIVGENMKFKGDGYINLNTKTLNIKIDVIMTVKLLNNIPIVNYILFGKNGGMTIKIKLSGNMYDPKVSPNVTQNILMGPVNIIKRTLLTPFRPFMEDK